MFGNLKFSYLRLLHENEENPGFQSVSGNLHTRARAGADDLQPWRDVVDQIKDVGSAVLLSVQSNAMLVLVGGVELLEGHAAIVAQQQVPQLVGKHTLTLLQRE